MDVYTVKELTVKLGSSNHTIIAPLEVEMIALKIIGTTFHPISDA